jgi:hypothetical protein
MNVPEMGKRGTVESKDRKLLRRIEDDAEKVFVLNHRNSLRRRLSL